MEAKKETKKQYIQEWIESLIFEHFCNNSKLDFSDNDEVQKTVEHINENLSGLELAEKGDTPLYDNLVEYENDIYKDKLISIGENVKLYFLVGENKKEFKLVDNESDCVGLGIQHYSLITTFNFNC